METTQLIIVKSKQSVRMIDGVPHRTTGFPVFDLHGKFIEIAEG